MKKTIFIIFCLSFIYSMNASAITLDEAIAKIEKGAEKEPESPSEKAQNYMTNALNSAKDSNEKISIAILSYLTFEHKFLTGYTNYCQNVGVNLDNFKTIFDKANAQVKSKVYTLLEKNKSFADLTKEMLNAKDFINTENNSINEEFKQVTMAGFSSDEMCDIFNTKSSDDIDINYKQIFTEMTNLIMNYNDNSPIIIK